MSLTFCYRKRLHATMSGTNYIPVWIFASAHLSSCFHRAKTEQSPLRKHSQPAPSHMRYQTFFSSWGFSIISKVYIRVFEFFFPWRFGDGLTNWDTLKCLVQRAYKFNFYRTSNTEPTGITSWRKINSQFNHTVKSMNNPIQFEKN